MARHYLDHASTSPMRPEAVAAIREWTTTTAGDPGRLHEEGRHVREMVEEARDSVAALLGVRARQVVFASGATEAINAAVWGATRRRPGGRILLAAVEHAAVRDSSALSAPVEEIAVDAQGTIDLEAMTAALGRTGDPPALVHCQWANHEVGTCQPVSEVVAACRQAGVLVHVDAAAAFGHEDLDLGTLGADLVSISAHKVGGPPGIGALVVRAGLRIPPLLLGGSQERARRAGMENVGGIVGFGATAVALGAAGALDREQQASRRHIEALVDAARSVRGVSVVGPTDPRRRLPHIVCLGIEGVEAEPVLLGLDRSGIAVHSGSACSSDILEPSPVLAAMGVASNHSLRLSVGWSTTAADVAAFADSFPTIVAAIRALRT